MFADIDAINERSEELAIEKRGGKETDKDQRSLKDLAPKVALPHAARVSAIIKVSTSAGGMSEYRTVKLPDALRENPVGLAIIFGLQDRPDKSLVTAYYRVNQVNRFLLFTEERLADDNSPIDLFRQYYNKLNEQVSQKTAGGMIAMVSVLVSHAVATPRFMSTLDAEQQHHLRRVVASIPRVPKVSSRPRAGLGELFEDLSDDRSLFDGLRDYAAWAMLEFQDHREELLQDEGVKTALSEALHLVGYDKNALVYRERRGRVLKSKNPSTLCDAVYEAVCRSDSLTLKERLLLGLREYRLYLTNTKGYEVVTREKLDEWLSRCRKHYLRNGCQSIVKTALAFDHCDLRSLVKPTDAECICLQWLLAGVSVQKSGQQRAQVNDYVIQASSTYLQYEKQRSKKKHKNTDPISKKSYVGKAISGFIALKQSEGGSHSRLLEKNSYLTNMTSTRPSWRFLLSATWENSEVRHAFLEKHPKGDAFLSLLTQFRVHGDQYAQYKNEMTRVYAKYPAGDERKRNVEELKRTMPVTVKKTLSCESIRRTRISLDEVSPGQSSSARDAEERANAESNGHTVDVFRTVYRNRDNSRYRLKSRSEFAAAVGELMVVLSEKIGELKKSVEVLTPENVAEAIGLESGFESEEERASRVLAELIVRGYKLNYFGAATKGNSRIILETPVTVALLLDAQEAYLSVAGDETATNERVMESALEYGLLESVIDRMSRRVVDRGRELHKVLSLPSQYLPMNEG